jgi:hypothetical protein
MGGNGNVIVLRGITGTPVDGYEWDGAKEVLDQILGSRSSAASTPTGITRGQDCGPELPRQPSQG